MTRIGFKIKWFSVWCLMMAVIIFVAGCSVPQKEQAMQALGKANDLGERIAKIEMEAGNVSDAQKITSYVSIGKRIYDSNDIESNCGLIADMADIADVWLKEKYPDKDEYRILLAILSVEIKAYCEQVK